MIAIDSEGNAELSSDYPGDNISWASGYPSSNFFGNVLSTEVKEVPSHWFVSPAPVGYGPYALENAIQELRHSVEQMHDGILQGCRRFELVRTEDVSGVSGTGFVAKGAILPSGTTIIEWASDTPSIVVWNSIEDAMAVHGHGGRTEFAFLDV